MADVCFSKTEVVISQPSIEICRRNLVCWQTLTFWRQWHQQIRNRNWYLAIAAAILRNGNDVIFLQWVLRFGGISAAWCRMTWKLRKVVEIKTGSRIPIWRTFVFQKRRWLNLSYQLKYVEEIWFSHRLWPSEGSDINKCETGYSIERPRPPSR